MTSRSEVRVAYPHFPADRRGVWVSPERVHIYSLGTTQVIGHRWVYVVYADARCMGRWSTLGLAEEQARVLIRLGAGRWSPVA